jgi:hypothetical protein
MSGHGSGAGDVLAPVSPDAMAGIARLDTFGSFFQRFEQLIGSAGRMSLYFIHSRRWRENHDAALKAFLGRDGTSLEIFLPDLENHELMFSIARHFDDGPLVPALVVDGYKYFGRLAREFGKPAHVWLFSRYPTYSFYRFDDRTVMALYSNTAAKKELPALEITTDGTLGQFLASDIADLRKECRKLAPEDLDGVIRNALAQPHWEDLV